MSFVALVALHESRSTLENVDSQVLSEKLSGIAPDSPHAKVTDALAATFEETNAKLSKTEIPAHQGCTAVACLVRGVGAARRLFVANAGDVRAVVW